MHREITARCLTVGGRTVRLAVHAELDSSLHLHRSTRSTRGEVLSVGYPQRGTLIEVLLPYPVPVDSYL